MNVLPGARHLRRLRPHDASHFLLLHCPCAANIDRSAPMCLIDPHLPASSDTWPDCPVSVVYADSEDVSSVVRLSGGSGSRNDQRMRFWILRGARRPRRALARSSSASTPSPILHRMYALEIPDFPLFHATPTFGHSTTTRVNRES